MTSVSLAEPSSLMSRDERQVVLAASLGASLEWYDFFVFASLAGAIASNFFSGLDPGTAFVFALLTFAAGFIVRPIGSLFFGSLGDKEGRKHTFLATVIVMGAATFLIGVLPTYSSIGLSAPGALIVLRMMQGFALGGEYGAAASYVAEHAPKNKRGAFTSWIQTTSTMGLLLSLIVVTIARYASGSGFNAWGWRFPFLFSIVLLVLSVYIRSSMSESPAFRRIKNTGRTSRAPLAESFGQWRHVRLVLQALFGLLAGQAVVWFTALFYSMFFLTETLKVDAFTANLLVGAALVVSIPFYPLFGRLSDRIGRKPIILGGCLLAALTIFPVFHGLTWFANPALALARANAPVVLVRNPADCSLQFNPTGTARFTRSCDVARRVLAGNAVSYAFEDDRSRAEAHVRIGAIDIAAPSLTAVAPVQAKALEEAFRHELQETIAKVGYPLQADPATINKPMVIFLLIILMIYGAMTLGPISAAVVEMFPTRIRYSAMSLPYHVGNGYLGGFLPAIGFMLVAQFGDIYAGLWYPVLVAAVSCVVGFVFIKETRDVDIFSDD